jgi:hypothetical protein
MKKPPTDHSLGDFCMLTLTVRCLRTLKFREGGLGRDKVELIASTGHAHLGFAVVAQSLDLIEVGHDDDMALHPLEFEDRDRSDGAKHARRHGVIRY